MGWKFYNSSGQQLSTAATSIDVLDIDGATDIGAAIVDADLFIIDDGAGGTNRKTAASRIKTYTAVNVKVGNFTRDTATASGDQSITGVGFTPKSLLFIGGQNQTTEINWGVSDGSTEFSLADRYGNTDNTYGISTSRWGTFIQTGSLEYSGVVKSLDADGFTLTWTRTSTPSGTLSLSYLAIG